MKILEKQSFREALGEFVGFAKDTDEKKDSQIWKMLSLSSKPEYHGVDADGASMPKPKANETPPEYIVKYNEILEVTQASHSAIANIANDLNQVTSDVNQFMDNQVTMNTKVTDFIDYQEQYNDDLQLLVSTLDTALEDMAFRMDRVEHFNLSSGQEKEFDDLEETGE